MKNKPKNQPRYQPGICECSQMNINTYYHCSFRYPKFLISEEAFDWAKSRSCIWLLEKIAILQTYPIIKRNPELPDLQIWIVEFDENRLATLRCEGEKSRVVYQDKIERTESLPDRVTFYCYPALIGEDIDGPHHILLFPSEY